MTVIRINGILIFIFQSIGIIHLTLVLWLDEYRPPQLLLVPLLYRPIRFLTVVLSGFLIFGACAPLRVPVIEKKAPIETFKYAYIRPTETLDADVVITAHA